MEGIKVSYKGRGQKINCQVLSRYDTRVQASRLIKSQNWAFFKIVLNTADQVNIMTESLLETDKLSLAEIRPMSYSQDHPLPGKLRSLHTET